MLRDEAEERTAVAAAPAPHPPPSKEKESPAAAAPALQEDDDLDDLVREIEDALTKEAEEQTVAAPPAPGLELDVNDYPIEFFEEMFGVVTGVQKDPSAAALAWGQGFVLA